jgi:hypothetical protein
MLESQVTESKDVPRGTILEAVYVPAYEGEEMPILVEVAAESLGISLKRFLGYCADRRYWMPKSDGVWVYPTSLEGLREYLKRTADHASEVQP